MKKTCSVILAENYCSFNSTRGLFMKLPNVIRDFGIGNLLIGTDKQGELKILKYILHKKEELGAISITAVIASEKNIINWSEEQRDLFFDLVTRCDKELLLAPPIESLETFYKNLVMLDLADIVILVGSDPNLEYIMKKNDKHFLRFDSYKQCLIPDISLAH